MINLNLDLALKSLLQQYDVLGEPIDLSVFYNKDGENKLFNTLKAHYRPVFEHNQRIIVLQPSRDQYSFDEYLASDALIFLQECLQKIDISNFFVTVVTSNKNIQAELEWLRLKFSTDDNPINFHIIDSEFEKTIKKRDTFCVNMWSHLYISTQLEMFPCCSAKQDRPLGDLKQQTVEEIINSESARSIRLKMLDNQSCVECEQCYKQEDSIGVSKRIRDNRIFQQNITELIDATNKDGSLQKFAPVYVDIRLGNLCNLKCRTCSGVFSSQIAAEEKQLFGNTENFDKMVPIKIREQAFTSVIKYLDSVEVIYFSGGEPLINKEHYNMLDYLIEKKKTNIFMQYNTNFTNLNFKDQNILDYWKKFSKVTVGASLDGHGKRFEYIRHGAKWSDIEQNLKNLKDHCPHVKFNVTSTISLLSVESVMELQRMWHENKILDINYFSIGLMQGSNNLSLQSLSDINKDRISKKIHKHCIWLRSVNASNLANEWLKINNYMLAENKFYINQQFAKVNRVRDLARGESFEQLYPELADMFKPYYQDKI